MWNFVWVDGFDGRDRDEDKRVLCQGRWIRVRKDSVGIGNSVSCVLHTEKTLGYACATQRQMPVTCRKQGRTLGGVCDGP